MFISLCTTSALLLLLIGSVERQQVST